jgi:hypothetical protein
MWTTLRYAPSCPHIHTDYYDYDPVNTISHKGEMHFKNSTFGVLTKGSTLDSLVLIGGPLRNQVTRFFAEKEPLLKFDVAHTVYVERVGEIYQKVETRGIVAILVKMIVEEQTVVFAFGNGEAHTKSAVQYLIENWRKLNREYPHQDLGICLSVDQNGKAKVEKILSKRITRAR